MMLSKNIPILDLMAAQEMNTSHRSREKIWQQIHQNHLVIKDAVKKGLTGYGVFSPIRLTDGEAVKLINYRKNGKTLAGDYLLIAVEGAIAINEVNASLCIICATLTSGSPGNLPEIMFATKNKLALNDNQMVQKLFCTNDFGVVIANNTMISGHAGVCKAEVGSPSGVTATAAVEVGGGSSKRKC